MWEYHFSGRADGSRPRSDTESWLLAIVECEEFLLPLSAPPPDYRPNPWYRSCSEKNIPTRFAGHVHASTPPPPDQNLIRATVLADPLGSSRFNLRTSVLRRGNLTGERTSLDQCGFFLPRARNSSNVPRHVVVRLEEISNCRIVSVFV